MCKVSVGTCWRDNVKQFQHGTLCRKTIYKIADRKGLKYVSYLASNYHYYISFILRRPLYLVHQSACFQKLRGATYVRILFISVKLFIADHLLFNKAWCFSGIFSSQRRYYIGQNWLEGWVCVNWTESGEYKCPDKQPDLRKWFNKLEAVFCRHTSGC